MKKLFTFLLLTLGIASVGFANNSYYVNDSAVEDLLESSEQVNPFANATDMASIMAIQADDKNPWIASIIDFFLGGLAIHRLYLGGSPILVVGYLFTFGGIFGLLPLGDLIALIINSGDISKYVGSDAFIMW